MNDDNGFFPGMFTGALLTTILGLVIVFLVKKEFQFDAVEQGVAEYFVSEPLTGKTEFRWKKPPTGKITPQEIESRNK